MKARLTTRMVTRGVNGVILVASIIVSVVTLAGCSHVQPETAVDRSILSDDPCAAPCWQGIVPGETSSSEAWDILTRLEFIDHDLYPYRGRAEAPGREYFNWRTTVHDDPAKVGGLYAQDGVVTRVDTALDFELGLQEVLDKYGVPEMLLSYQRGVERITCYIHFYYPNRGLIFVSWADPVPVGKQYTLAPTTPITQVYYFKPTTMDLLLDELPEYTRRLPFGREHLVAWRGLGPIDVLR